MIRFYLCDVVGSGTDEDPLRPYVAKYTPHWRTYIETDGMGTSVMGKTIARVDMEDFSELDADPNLLDVTK